MMQQPPLPEILNLALSDSNPVTYNAIHLEAIIELVQDNTEASMLHHIAINILRLLIYWTTSYFLNQHIRAIGGSASVMQRVLPDILKNIFPEPSYQATIWRTIHSIVREKSQDLVNQLGNVQEEIKRLDARISASIDVLALDGKPAIAPHNYQEVYRYLVIRQTAILAAPRTLFNYLEKLDKTDMADFLNTFGMQRLILEAIICTIAAKSVMDGVTGERVQIMFYGAPGVGKDYMVRRLCQLLGGPVIDFNAEVAPKPPAFEIEPSFAVEKHPEKLDVAYEANLLATQVKRTGVKNPILLINEFDADFRYAGWKTAYFKKLFDNTAERRDLFGDLIIFVITNDAPKDFPEAIADRFTTIKIDAPNEEM